MREAKQMRVEVVHVNQAPDLSILARHLLPKIREAFQDPEYEKKFQEWKKQREEGRHGNDKK